MVAHFELFELSIDADFELFDGFVDTVEHLCELVAKSFYLGVDHVVIHLAPGFFIYEVVINVGLFGQSLHSEGHFLLI